MLKFICEIGSYIFAGGMAAIALAVIGGILSIPIQVFLADKSQGIEKVKTLVLCVGLFVFLAAFLFFG